MGKLEAADLRAVKLCGFSIVIYLCEKSTLSSDSPRAIVFKMRREGLCRGRL